MGWRVLTLTVYIWSLFTYINSFKKIVVVKDYMTPWRDENGILYIGIEQFLLDDDSLDV